MRTRIGAAFLGVFGAACISTVPPPEPTKTADVPYGEKIYLRDQTLGDRPDRCFLLGALDTSSTGQVLMVGDETLLDDQRAYNCYVEVVPGTVTVEVIETTNDLFQLCVDSTICKKPDPADVDKLPVCANEDQFGTCPVVSVQQVEAERFCEFVGRRLPTMIEHLVIRQQNAPQSPDLVQKFAYGDDPAPTNCDIAVLKGCSKPTPMTVNASETTGAARLDKTSQGVFDLTGNATEWALDLMPSLRGPASELPWFCLAPLPDDSVDAMGRPVCPTGEVCIKGEYKVVTASITETRSDWPVCIAPRDLKMVNGTVGSVMGGNFANSDPTPVSAGVFARQQKEKPNADPGDATHGFRCLGVAGMPSDIVAR